MIIIKLPQNKTVETPQGADYFTCPLCEVFSSTFVNEADEDTSVRSITWCHFCLNCNIIFDIGCEVSNRGCTDITYNAVLIKSFISQNGEIMTGMPIFESFDEMTLLLEKMDAKLVCTCFKIGCKYR